MAGNSAPGTGTSTRRRSYLAQLIDLPVHPAHALPRLAAQQGTLSLLGFPAISGVFFAYMVATGLALGDSFGVAAVAVAVLLIGSLLGVLALWFAGTLPNWGAPDDAAIEAQTNRMFVLFSDATWPFLPLLLIVVAVDVYYGRTAVFSSVEPATPPIVTWLVRALILATLLVWVTIMIRGTAVVRQESERRAAGEIARWTADLVAIAVLFALILAASLMYW